MPNRHALVASSVLALCFTAPSLLAQCGDYNGDGFEDLPAGTGWEDVGGVIEAGALNVIYGTGNGLKANNDQVFTRNTSGIGGDLQIEAFFGSAVASGDFDLDGFDDVAVSAPLDTVEGISQAGSVTVLYGRGSGLSTSGDQLWHTGFPGVIGDVENSRFGWALAAGDFDGDGHDDLAIGEPFDGPLSTGAVHILYGSNSGLRATGDQFFTQDTAGIRGTGESGDQFGYALAAGDFDGDGRDDLAIGVLSDNVEGVLGAGAVAVLYGTAGGLSAVGDQLWHQNRPGIADSVEESEHFGGFLAAGDFDDDGRDDLAIGNAAEDVGASSRAGTVSVLYGTSSGLSAAGDQFLHQDSPGVRDTAGFEQFFGIWLAAGDFDGDGRDDLAVAVLGEDVDGLSQAGAVAVFYGTNSGLTVAGDQLIHQNSPGVQGTATLNGRFGTTLYVGDFDDDGRDDLGVVKINEDIGAALSAGTITVLYGSNNGVSAAGEQVWSQDSSGIKDVAESGDAFGTLWAPAHE